MFKELETLIKQTTVLIDLQKQVLAELKVSNEHAKEIRAELKTNNEQNKQMRLDILRSIAAVQSGREAEYPDRCGGVLHAAPAKKPEENKG